MRYDKRNRENLNKLAYNTRMKALQWYQYCIDNDIDILIYETIRSVETQRENVRKGASQTMRSYHIVGQALDFVPVNSKGETLWNGYTDSKVKRAINKAITLGFEWGGNWKSFKDMPHLQYVYKGYGTDVFKSGLPVAPINPANPSSSLDDLVERTLRGEFGNGEERKNKLGNNYNAVQNIIRSKMYSVDINELVEKTLRGDYGNGEERKKKLGKYYKEVQNIINKM